MEERYPLMRSLSYCTRTVYFAGDTAIIALKFAAKCRAQMQYVYIAILWSKAFTFLSCPWIDPITANVFFLFNSHFHSALLQIWTIKNKLSLKLTIICRTNDSIIISVRKLTDSIQLKHKHGDIFCVFIACVCMCV